MLNADVISMPDKWEYPWYAAWDLAFHTIRARAGRFRIRQEAAQFILRDLYAASERPDARVRVELQRREPAGPCRAPRSASLQVRAELGAPIHLPRSVVPGAHAQFQLVGESQRPTDRNVFDGGFLGLDNIGIFDRSRPLPGRRIARSGRRDRVDGVLLAEHAGDGHRT